MEADELLLWSDALGIEGNRKWDIGACIEIRIASERDRVAVWVTQQHSSSNSSETSTSSSSNGASKRERSSSTSTSIWTDVNYFDIAVWNGKRIELSLEGGDFVECAIDRGRGRCEVEFNIDEGKRKRTIRLESGVVTVDGKPLETDGDYSEILIEATRRSLKITADGDVIGKWK